MIMAITTIAAIITYVVFIFFTRHDLSGCNYLRVLSIVNIDYIQFNSRMYREPIIIEIIAKRKSTQKPDGKTKKEPVIYGKGNKNHKN